MKFKELTEDELIQKIIALKEGLNCSPMWRTVFNSIHPKVKKSMPLKNKLKPHEKLAGPYTEMHLQMRGNSELMIKAQQKLRANGFYGEYYDNPEASLKMHLGLNNIGELDESVVLKLVKFLADEAESPDNQTSFHFKIIRPDQHLSERFKNTDQITIYFDKYSSVGDFMRLARRVDEFLKSQGLPENAIKLGPKDSFGFNSFATARFDTNKLLSEYHLHTFFDLELKKFFESHTEEELKDAPL